PAPQVPPALELGQKRVEPPVAGASGQSSHRVEPPVVSSFSQQQQRRYEPPVRNAYQDQYSQINRQYGEPPVRSWWGRRMEPPVNMGGERRMEPAVNSVPGWGGMFNVFTPNRLYEGNYLAATTASAFLPELRGDETSEELALREELAHLFSATRQNFKRSKKLVNGIWLVIVLSCLIYGLYYYSTVLSYASLDSRIAVERDPLDPERLILEYTPHSKGQIGFARQDASRESVVLDSIGSRQVGEPQRFQWRIRGLKSGDPIRIWSRDGFKFVQKEIFVPQDGGRSVVFSGANTLSGVVVNALDGLPIPNVVVRILGTDLSARSKENGEFVLEKVPDGPQKYEVLADGFMKVDFSSDISKGEPSDVRIALSPGLKEGQIRLVLTWDKKPNDLDAHLEGPLPNNERFHISFQDKGNLESKEFVQLDCDAREGFGPETITVLGVLPGKYRYYVHDYSNQKEVESSELAQSNANVRVYYGGQYTDFAPLPDKKGNLWNVCEIEIADDLSVKVNPLGDFENQKIEGLGLYEKRTREDRMEWIAEYGGSESSEDAVKLALRWLARHQCTKKGDSYGSWGRYCLIHDDERCRCVNPASADTPEGAEGAPADAAKDYTCTDTIPFENRDYCMASTGLAVLAFQAGGNYYHNEHRYSNNVKAGLNWMIKQQYPNGLLISPKMKPYPGMKYHEKFMYEHSIATFALAEACALAKASGEEIEPKYRMAMLKAIKFIIDTQHLDGGWRYTTDPAEESDTSVTGWVVLALKSGKEAGAEIPYKTIDKIRAFFKDRTRDTQTRYTKVMAGTEALTGIGMLVRQFLLDEPNSEYVHGGARRLSDWVTVQWKNQEEGAVREPPDYYLLYKCSLALQQVGGRDWERWNSLVRDELISLQEKQGCERGSWSPHDDPWGEYGGRVYTTALGALTLQVYYRYATQEDRSSGLRTTSAITSRTVPVDADEGLHEMAEDLGAVRQKQEETSPPSESVPPEAAPEPAPVGEQEE
ncbi:MAG: carboxypeptidase regulatory-like domain-containing protein, partial [Planctomycetia bacterium]|nr:carboxypeptidase regulatory-like domain-containing protein [Planctomycetia bacterium]